MKRLIKYFILVVFSISILSWFGVYTINRQLNIETKTSVYKLTKFDYIVGGASNTQVDTFYSMNDEFSGAFPVVSMKATLTSSATSVSDMYLLFSDHMEDFDYGLLTKDTLLYGDYNADGLMLDEYAANKLNCNVGDTITYNLLGREFSINVSGIYRTSTYKILNTGIGVLKWNIEQSSLYDDIRYSMVFVKANDITKCEEYLNNTFVPEVGILDFESWYQKNKDSSSITQKTILQTEEEYKEELKKDDYIIKYKNIMLENNKLKYEIQKKADYLVDVEEETIATKNKINLASILAVTITPVVFVVMFIIFMFKEKEQIERMVSMGVGKKTELKKNTLPALLSGITVSLVTFIFLFIYQSTLLKSSEYMKIVLLFSLPVLFSVLVFYPIIYSFISKRFKAGTIVNNNSVSLQRMTRNDDEISEDETLKQELNAKTIDELKALMEEKKITPINGLDKAELVDRLFKHIKDENE